MKKIILFFISMCILFAFTACSSKNIENSSSSNNADSAFSDVQSSTQLTKTTQKTLSFNGVNYPVNSTLDFEVKDMEYEEEDDVTYVSFCSDDADKLDDIENHDFSNGKAQWIIYIYDCNYNDLINGGGRILGSYKYEYSAKNPNGFDGWQTMYAPDGDIIFKTDLNYLECGLYSIYYDNNDNVIARYSDYDNTNSKCLFEKSDGTIIDDDELRTLLERFCPNEYLEGFI